MKPNELRIGNHVLYLQRECEVVLIGYKTIKLIDLDDKKDYCVNIRRLEPIDITYDLLLKLGFNNNQITAFDKNNINLEITFDGNGKYLQPAEICVYKYKKDENNDGYADEVHYLKLDNIKYVHRLQNLYFALTGKELEIK